MTKNMKENHKYVFDKKSNILFKYYYGEITIEDIHTSWDSANKENLIPKETKGIILDYQNATFKIPVKEHVKIAEYYSEHIDVFRGMRIAIVTQNPSNAVIPTLVEMKDNGYKSKLFSTENTAIAWVKS